MTDSNPAADTQINGYDNVRAVQWMPDGVCILDQRKLPDKIVYQTYTTADDVAEAIKTMQVRGAPAIGIAAAYGVVLAARDCYARNRADWRQPMDASIKRLAEARPTAVNLFWALDKMRTAIADVETEPEHALLEIAQRIHSDDIAANRTMGEAGADLLSGTRGVLTHCNTGSLATGGYGTALGVIRSARRRGLEKIFATETRPWLQGARLTLWELNQDRIPATLIADSAAAWLMRSGKIQWVIVGADRIAANGDVANKIGTYSLAVLARQHDAKFMVVAPTSTIDWQTSSGERIPIETRPENELLLDCYESDDATVKAWNPVFDVTPARLINAIVTEKGVVLDPDGENMQDLPD